MSNRWNSFPSNRSVSSLAIVNHQQSTNRDNWNANNHTNSIDFFGSIAGQRQRTPSYAQTDSRNNSIRSCDSIVDNIDFDDNNDNNQLSTTSSSSWQQQSADDTNITFSTKNCNYMKLVNEFKRTLVLPDAYFSCEHPICYCTTCTSKNVGTHCIKGNISTRSTEGEI